MNHTSQKIAIRLNTCGRMTLERAVGESLLDLVHRYGSAYAQEEAERRIQTCLAQGEREEARAYAQFLPDFTVPEKEDA